MVNGNDHLKSFVPPILDLSRLCGKKFRDCFRKWPNMPIAPAMAHHPADLDDLHARALAYVRASRDQRMSGARLAAALDTSLGDLDVLLSGSELERCDGQWLSRQVPELDASGEASPNQTDVHRHLAHVIRRTEPDAATAARDVACHLAQAGHRDEAIQTLRTHAASLNAAHRYEAALLLWDDLVDLGTDVDGDAPSAVLTPDEQFMHACAARECADPRSADLLERTADAARSADLYDLELHALTLMMHDVPSAATRALMLSRAEEIADASLWSEYVQLSDRAYEADWDEVVSSGPLLLERVRQEHDAHLEVHVLSTLALAFSYRNEIESSQLAQRGCLSLARSLGTPTLEDSTTNIMSEIQAEMLDVDGALLTAKEWWVSVRSRDLIRYRSGAQALLAARLLDIGDARDARATIDAATRDEKSGAAVADPYTALRRADIALSTLSDLDDASDAIRGAAEAVERDGYALWVDAIAILEADLAGWRGDVAAATAARDRVGIDDPDVWCEATVRAIRALVGAGAEHASVAHLVDRLDELRNASTPVTTPLTVARCDEIDAWAGVLRGTTADPGTALRQRADQWEAVGRGGDALVVRALAALCDFRSSGESDIGDLIRTCGDLSTFGFDGYAQRIEQAAGCAKTADADATPIDSLFGLTRGDLSVRSGSPRTIAAGDRACPTDGAEILVVSSGCVLVMSDLPEGRSVAVDVLGPGDIVALPRRGDSTNFAFEIEATAGDADVLWLGARQVDAWAEAAPAGCGRALVAACAHYAEVIERSALLATRPVEVRVASVLLRLAERFGRPTTKGDVLIDVQLTQEALAGLVGSRRTKCSLVVNELRRAGLITSFRRRMVIIDRAALESTVAADAAADARSERRAGRAA